MTGKARGRKSIFITGGASGMGRETAKLFSGKGWFVGAYDVNEAGLAALPLLKNAKNSLVFITSSSSATYGMPRIAVYSATKHAVKGLTEALSIEFKRHGIRVADLLPGLIDTNILRATPNRSGDAPKPTEEEFYANAPKKGMFRLTPPRAVAECVWQAYGSDR